MHLEYAAHVKHPVSHSSSAATIGLGIAGAVIAAAVVIYSGGTALVVLGAVGTAGDVGMGAGGIIDKYLPRSIDGYVVSGLPTVLLGPGIQPAARADSPDSKVDCDDEEIAEGSRSVMLGPELKPMSRRGDRTKCGGRLEDGIHSIIVGGAPSMQGINISERTPTIVTVMSVTFGVAGSVSTISGGSAIDLVQGSLGFVSAGLTAAGQGDAGSVVGLATLSQPGNLLDWAGAVNSVYQGAGGAVNLATSIIAPSPP